MPAMPRLPQLDARLEAVAQAFMPCEYGADIGADHGRLGCWLLANDRCQRMALTDISAPSLQKARLLLERFGFSQRADFFVGNGLDVVPAGVRAAAICGMGGRTIAGMLGAAMPRQVEQLVVCPHSEPEAARRALQQAGYAIEAEQIVRVGRRYYGVISARQGRSAWDEAQLYTGVHLRPSASATVAEYLAHRLRAAKAEQNEAGALHRQWLEEAICRA